MNLKNSVDFLHRNLTLKIWFWHFLTNHNSLQDCFKTMSFEHVDSWAKILPFKTHHLWNPTTEPISRVNWSARIWKGGGGDGPSGSNFSATYPDSARKKTCWVIFIENTYWEAFVYGAPGKSQKHGTLFFSNLSQTI